MPTHEHKVRLAEEYDIAFIVKVFCKRMLEEEYKSPILFDADTQANLVFSAVNSRTCWVSYYGDDLTGVVVSVPSPFIYNSKLSCLSELVWYVLPEYRRTRAALLLLNSFTEESTKYDVSTLSSLPSSDVENRALIKRGFKMKEYGFMRTKWQQ